MSKRVSEQANVKVGDRGRGRLTIHTGVRPPVILDEVLVLWYGLASSLSPSSSSNDDADELAQELEGE